MQKQSESMRVLIVDDEPLARQGLRLHLAQAKGIEIVGEAEHAEQALQLVQEKKPDVILLDIDMPGDNGIEMARQLRGKVNLKQQLPQIIFITAHKQYALDAFAEHAIDYLLKPIDPQRLQAALKRVRSNLELQDAGEQQEKLQEYLNKASGKDADSEMEPKEQARQLANLIQPKKMVFKDGHTTLRIDQHNIRWIEAAGDYMCVQTDDDTHVVRTTMKSIESEADPDILQRVHRSTIVNVSLIKSMRPHSNGEYFITLECGKQVKLSRHYRDKLEQLQQ